MVEGDVIKPDERVMSFVISYACISDISRKTGLLSALVLMHLQVDALCMNYPFFTTFPMKHLIEVSS